MRNLFITILCLLTAASSFAADTIGKVTKYKGNVAVYDGTSPRGVEVKQPGVPIALSGKVATKRASAAVIELETGDKVALDENSLITFGKDSKFDPQGGKVVFKIKKRGAAAGVVKVGLKTAVIGVKGTEFLVDMTDEGKCNVYLKDGVINVESTEGEFKKQKAVEIDEYQAYIMKLTGEYDKYIEDLKNEYTEYVKSFDMQAGQAISIDGNNVNDVKFDNEAEAAFNLFDMEMDTE